MVNAVSSVSMAVYNQVSPNYVPLAGGHGDQYKQDNTATNTPKTILKPIHTRQ